MPLMRQPASSAHVPRLGNEVISHPIVCFVMVAGCSRKAVLHLPWPRATRNLGSWGAGRRRDCPRPRPPVVPLDCRGKTRRPS